jgi:GNAT superfamily N-acetyltransferase
VRQIEEEPELVGWIAERFAPAWATEVRRALGDGAVFVVGPPGEYLGFAAHSGNNGTLGSFGPLGVLPEAQKRGLGSALAVAALSDLARRGHLRITIPWVERDRVLLYRRLVRACQVHPRVVLADRRAERP